MDGPHCMIDRISEARCRAIPGQYLSDTGRCYFLPRDASVAGTSGAAAAPAGGEPRIEWRRPMHAASRPVTPPGERSGPAVAAALLDAAAGALAAAPVERASGGCDGHYQRVEMVLQGNAQACGLSSGQMVSLTDMLPAASSEDIGHLTVERHSGLMKLVGGQAWTATGRFVEVSPGTLAPECRADLRVTTQQESFIECVRVYLCGLRTVACARELARSDTTLTCTAASARCLESHPIPGNITGPAAPVGEPRAPALRPAPAGHWRPSGISGPSGAGGGGPTPFSRSAQ